VPNQSHGSGCRNGGKMKKKNKPNVEQQFFYQKKNRFEQRVKMAWRDQNIQFLFEVRMKFSRDAVQRSSHSALAYLQCEKT
jgi:hypothetical protein